MQRRVKTYGKHSSRIITVTEDRNNAIPQTTGIQPTVNNHVSISESSDDQPKYSAASNRGKSVPNPTRKMDNSHHKVSNKSRPHVEISRAATLNLRKHEPVDANGNQSKASLNIFSLPQHPKREQPRSTSATTHFQRPENAAKSKGGDKGTHTVRAGMSETSDSSDALPPRSGLRVAGTGRNYIVSDDSDTNPFDSASDEEASEPHASSSEPDCHSPISRYGKKRGDTPPTPPKKKVNDRKKIKWTHNSGGIGSPDRVESSSMAPRPRSRPDQGKRAILLSSDSNSVEIPLSESKDSYSNGGGKIHAGTPQVKASHLRQARFRKATPFKSIPRISLASTLTLSPLSPLNIIGQTRIPTETRAAKDIRKTGSPPLQPSSPLTWEESLTPEAARLLDLMSDDEEQGSSMVALEKLLKFAGQVTPVEFASFLETFKMQEIYNISSTGKREKARNVQRTSLNYRKIGDASYSEVFAIGDLVLKVIPLAVEIDTEDSGYSEEEDDETPFKSLPENVLKEIMITKTTGDAVVGFVKLLRTYIVKGKYPKLLLKEWDEFKRNGGSDGIRPDSFTEHQLYAIVVLPNGGIDLETYTFAKTSSSKGGTGWRDAAEVFWQVTAALAKAEEVLKFEHRDLHWGQIVVRKNTINGKEAVIATTIIDLGLSRIETDGAVQFSSFEEEVFTGCGVLPGSDGAIELDEDVDPDYQFDIYRLMRHYNGDDWAAYRPLTNVMWLHYLSLKLLRHKGLRKPTSNGRKSTIPGKHRVSADTLASLPHMESEWHAYQQLVAVEWCLGSRLENIVENMAQKLGKGMQTTKVKKQARPLKAIEGQSSKKTAMSIESAADVAVLWFAKAL